MAERVVSPAAYVIVCVVLILLTFLTVSFSFVNAIGTWSVSGVWHLVIGLIIAVAKASLVVLFSCTRCTAPG